MNDLQHTTIMAIEKMTANINEYHPSDKIASKVKNYIQTDLEQIQEALNLLCKSCQRQLEMPIGWERVS